MSVTAKWLPPSFTRPHALAAAPGDRPDLSDDPGASQRQRHALTLSAALHWLFCLVMIAP